MIKKWLSSVLAVLMLISASSIVYANDSVSVKISVNAETGIAELFGEASGLVSISVVPEDVAFSDADSELEKCIYFGLVESKNGEFKHNFAIPTEAEAGKYIVHIVSSTGNASCSFNKTASLDPSALAPLNGLSSETELRMAAEALATELGIDMSDENYSAYSTNAFKYIYSLKKSYTDVSEFYKDYTAAYALSAVVNADDMNSALRANAFVLGIDYFEDYADDERLTDESKENLFAMIENFSWDTVLEDDISESFAAQFNVLKAVSAVQAASTRVQLQKAICVDFVNVFDFLTEDRTYKGLKNPDNVFGYMLKDSLDDFDSIKSSFEYAVDSVYNDELPPRNNNGGSGGGGGSVGISSSAVSQIPSVPLTGNDSEAQKDENTASQSVFSDVKSDFWAYSAVSALASKGLISGYEDSTFRADNTITRAEFAKLVLSAYQAKGGVLLSGGIGFDDVNENDWYYDVADKASASELIFGSDNSFKPNENITRQDAAVIIYRALMKLSTQFDVQKSFDDLSSVASYAADAVSALSGAGVINGFEDNTFRPQNTLTRAQAAQIIYNVIK